MVDDNFPTDTKAPRPIKGTIWAKGQLPTLPRTLPRTTSASTLPKTQPLESLAEVAERLRLEARAGHRKYKGPNVFQHLLRRAPKGEPKPEVKSEAARNLAMMMTKKGKATRAN